MTVAPVQPTPPSAPSARPDQPVLAVPAAVLAAKMAALTTAPVTPATPSGKGAELDEAVRAAAQRAVVRQGGLAPLLADLAQVARRPDLPEPVRAAIRQVLELRVRADPPPSAAELKQALARSGLFLEARLAGGPAATRQPPPSAGSDLKAALLVFRQVLNAWAPPPAATTASSAPTPQAVPPSPAGAPQAALRPTAPPAPYAPPSTSARSAADAPQAPAAPPPAFAALVDPEAPPAPRVEARPQAAPPPAQGASRPQLQPSAEASRPAAPPASATPPPATPPTSPALQAEEALPPPAVPPRVEPARAEPAPHRPGGGSAPPPPPYARGPTSAQPPAAPSLSPQADPAAIGQLLLRETDAALARQELHQIASLPQPTDSVRPSAAEGPKWMFEIPLATQQGAAVAQFEIGRDGGGGGQAGGAHAPTWSARFSFDIEPMGPIHAHVALTGERAGVTLWAERPATLARLRDQEEALRAALRQASFAPEVTLRPGAPLAVQAAAPGQFVDRAT